MRTLLVLLTIACVAVAIHAQWRRDALRRTAIKARMDGLGPGMVIAQHEDFDGAARSRSYPRWLERWVGHEYLYPINAFCLVQSQNPDPIIREAAQLPHLYLVKLPACQITDESLQPLTKLRSLVWLELFATPITDEGVKTVCRIKSLEILDLRGTKATDACIESIRSMPRLKRLHVGGTAITPVGIEAIRKALPGCEIDQRDG